MATEATGPDLIAIPEAAGRLTVDEYLRLIASGRLADGPDVELLEGRITPKMSKNPPHDALIDLIHEYLARVLPAGWRIRIQSSVALPASVPEPDLAIVRGAARAYLERHPGPADIGLVVEVSESSLARDRGQRARIYASASIPAYWIVDVAGRSVDALSDPSGDVPEPSYRSRVVVEADGVVPFVLDGVQVARIVAGDLLP